MDTGGRRTVTSCVDRNVVVAGSDGDDDDKKRPLHVTMTRRGGCCCNATVVVRDSPCRPGQSIDAIDDWECYE